MRAILDANGLTKKEVDGVSVVKNGRIVELFLQEGSIAELPDAIGGLTALRKLHVYGDRTLNLPLLKKASPAIGKCTEIEELLLNQNDLTTLPAEIASLQKLRNLSVAENHLAGLPPEVTAWAPKFDPKGLADQTAPQELGKLSHAALPACRSGYRCQIAMAYPLRGCGNTVC